MIQVLRLEFRKMRRLRVLPILLTMVAAVVALSSISLFSPSSQEGFEDPASTPWAGLLLGYTMMAAMTSPILMAVLASRQTDIEHTGGGWFLSQVAGFAPGQLLRAKFASLSLLVVGAVALQSLAIIGLGIAAGIRVPLDLSPWMTYTGLLILVNIAFLALHLWLAATVENQLVGVGLGMVGAFISVFLLLVPPIYARFLPWGYYATISQVGTDGQGIIFVTPPYLWIAGFLILVAALFTIATRRFDRIER